MKVSATSVIRFGVLGAAGALFLIAVALTGWEASFSTRPGPTEYYSHFSGLFFASALAFDALQSLKHTLWSPRRKAVGIISCLVTYLTYLYWISLAVSGLICAISYGLAAKPDAVGIQGLIFLNSAVVLAKLAADHWSSKKFNNDNATHQKLEGISQQKKRLFATGRYFNRLLKFIRFVISILFIVGAVALARQYRFKNPGTIVQVTLASGKRLSISHHCTKAPPVNSTSLPTIWFESSPAHGVTDFLGVQTILLDTYGRNSCSYDPPNFGWSARWPSTEPANLTTILNPLLTAIQRQNEEKILVGWGGGVENVLRNSRLDADTVKGVVLLDASPNGIEWLDQKRAKNLTMKETMELAKTDMRGRVTSAQIILALGVPWGLLPIFIPANDTGYLESSHYPRHHAQAMKEDMWAMQYYVLQSQASDPFSTTLEDLVVRKDVPVYAIASYEAGSDDASNSFYRDEKLQLAQAVSGGELEKPIVWCKEQGCKLSFPVVKPGWTANSLMDLGI